MTGALTWGSDAIQWGGVALNWGDEPAAAADEVESGGAGQSARVSRSWRRQYDHLPKYTGTWEREEDFSDLDERDRLHRARDEEDAMIAILLSGL